MTDSKLLREARTYVKTIAGGVRRPLDARDRARMLSALSEHGVKLDAAEHGDAYIAARYDAEFSEGDHPRDEHGRFAAAVGASETAAKASAAANAKGTGRGAAPAHQRAMQAHQNAANMYIHASREHPEGSPEREQVMKHVHQELALIKPHEAALREMKNAKKAEEKANPKPVKATDINISALAAHITESGGGTEFTNRVAAVHAPHIQRAAKAGLVEHATSEGDFPRARGTLRLTPAGHAAVTSYLQKEATRLTHPYYNTPRDEQARTQVAAAITKLAANPPKRTDAEDRDARYDATFSGVDHPRDDHGRFASGDTQGATDKANAATKSAKSARISKDPSAYGMAHERAAAAHREAAAKYTPEIQRASQDLTNQQFLHESARTPNETQAKIAGLKVAQAQHEQLAAQHALAADRGRDKAVAATAKAAAEPKTGTAFNRNGEKVTVVTPGKPNVPDVVGALRPPTREEIEAHINAGPKPNEKPEAPQLGKAADRASKVAKGSDWQKVGPNAVVQAHDRAAKAHRAAAEAFGKQENGEWSAKAITHLRQAQAHETASRDMSQAATTHGTAASKWGKPGYVPPAPDAATLERARAKGAGTASVGSHAQAFEHNEWGPTVGFHQRGQTGLAGSYTTFGSMHEAKAFAEGHNAKVKEYESRGSTVSGGVPGRPQTSGKNTVPGRSAEPVGMGRTLGRGFGGGEHVNPYASSKKTGAAGFTPQPGDHPKLAARMKRYPVGAKVTTASSGALYTPEHAKQHYGTVVGHERSTGRVHVQFESGERRTVDPGSPATGVFLDRVHGK